MVNQMSVVGKESYVISSPGLQLTDLSLQMEPDERQLHMPFLYSQLIAGSPPLRAALLPFRNMAFII